MMEAHYIQYRRLMDMKVLMGKAEYFLLSAGKARFAVAEVLKQVVKQESLFWLAPVGVVLAFVSFLSGLPAFAEPAVLVHFSEPVVTQFWAVPVSEPAALVAAAPGH